MGISSYGKGCGRPEYPGIYARVSTQLDWIFKNSDAIDVQRLEGTFSENFRLQKKTS